MFFNLKNKMYTRLLQDLSKQHYIALILIGTLLAWSLALPAILKADTVSPGPAEVQIVLSDSAPGVTATHTISFKIATSSDGVADTEQIVIIYQEAGDSLNFDTSSVAGGDVTVHSGAIAFADAGANSLTFDINTALDGGQVIDVTVAGIVNPNHVFGADDPLSAVTHIVNVAVTGEDSADTRVAIIDNITMTAAVDTIFTFSVGGLDYGFDINGRTTTGTSSPTSFDFGTIAHDGGVYFLGHELKVNTNASNGFIVTIQESQELTSSTGERIHRFTDTVSGAEGTATPAIWTGPTPVLDDYHTYGHYGITTTDAELDDRTGNPDDAEFASGNRFVGDFHLEPRPIFGHTGPALDTNEHAGHAFVGVAIEISSLQPAGNDYTNTLTYVATPTF